MFFFIALAYLLYKIFKNQNKNEEVLVAAGYVVGFEVFIRMTGGISFSYEFAKYAVMGFMVLGLFFKGFKRNSLPYFMYLLFLIPGILFSAINLNYDSPFFNLIGFNLSGPICIGICALYCNGRKLSFHRLQNIMLAVLLPIISMTVYLYFYTPNIRDVLSGTQSNFEASGGFGPNQVATVLGLGLFILFTRLLIVKNKVINIIDLSLLALIGYRGIVTFSRGGIVTGVGCIIIFLIIYFVRSKTQQKANLIPKIVTITAIFTLTWIISSISTLGLIDKRYSNQDAAGRVKEDITTGRSELILAELNAFFENPITGIGVGKVKEYREAQTGKIVATHNEITRILSEHGIFGLGALTILLFTPLLIRIKDRSNIFALSFLAFWFLTINHSSMRIAAPAFIYGLCLISILNVKKRKAIIHRK